MLTKKQLQVLRLLAERELHKEERDEGSKLYIEFLRRLTEAIDHEMPEAPEDPEMDLSLKTIVTHKESYKNGK